MSYELNDQGRGPTEADSFAVVTAGRNDDERIAAYLYTHTTVVATADCGRFRAYVLRTHATSSKGHADFEAQRLNTYQCSRFESGLFHVVQRASTQTSALNALKHWLGEHIDNVPVARVA
jgi:hypothetical protein